MFLLLGKQWSQRFPVAVSEVKQVIMQFLIEKALHIESQFPLLSLSYLFLLLFLLVSLLLEFLQFLPLLSPLLVSHLLLFVLACLHFSLFSLLERLCSWFKSTLTQLIFRRWLENLKLSYFRVFDYDLLGCCSLAVWLVILDIDRVSTFTAYPPLSPLKAQIQAWAEELILSSTAHLVALSGLLGQLDVWDNDLIKRQVVMLVIVIVRLYLLVILLFIIIPILIVFVVTLISFNVLARHLIWLRLVVCSRAVVHVKVSHYLHHLLMSYSLFESSVFSCIVLASWWVHISCQLTATSMSLSFGNLLFSFHFEWIRTLLLNPWMLQLSCHLSLLLTFVILTVLIHYLRILTILRAKCTFCIVMNVTSY